MKTISYPTRDGYIEQRDCLFVVYVTKVIDGISIERIEGFFEYEANAIERAKDFSPDGRGVRVVEMLRMPEVSVR